VLKGNDYGAVGQRGRLIFNDIPQPVHLLLVAIASFVLAVSGIPSRFFKVKSEIMR